MGMRFTERPAGLAQACAAQPMQRACAMRMELARLYAMVFAPVDTGQYKWGAVLIGARGDEVARRKATGPFRRLPEGEQGGFVVVSGVRNGRAYARLIALAPYSIYLEWGTRYMRRQRILGRAADALRTL
jgi:hypothetical protein